MYGNVSPILLAKSFSLPVDLFPGVALKGGTFEQTTSQVAWQSFRQFLRDAQANSRVEFQEKPSYRLVKFSR